eukprot:778738-Pelagomonas_calceolata.AAC.5
MGTALDKAFRKQYEKVKMLARRSILPVLLLVKATKWPCTNRTLLTDSKGMRKHTHAHTHNQA